MLPAASRATARSHPAPVALVGERSMPARERRIHSWRLRRFAPRDGPGAFRISTSPHRDALMLAPDPDLGHIRLADLLDADVGVLPSFVVHG